MKALITKTKERTWRIGIKNDCRKILDMRIAEVKVIVVKKNQSIIVSKKLYLSLSILNPVFGSILEQTLDLRKSA